MDRLERLLAMLEADDPRLVQPVRMLAERHPDAPLAEVWLRARRSKSSMAESQKQNAD